MIGSQITAQFWMSPQLRPPSVAGGKIWPTLKVSLPSSRENVWLATSRRQSAGSVPPGAASSCLNAARAWSQVRSPVSWTVMR